MTNVHLVIPELFLPKQMAAEVCAGLVAPALGTLLARANAMPLSTESLESWLCAAFGVADMAIAPVTLRADGLLPASAYCLCADPVHLSLQHDQLLLFANLPLTSQEAAQLCDSLNEHFRVDGLRFCAPCPQRWYLQLDEKPNISTFPLALVAGRDIHPFLPRGEDALRWHGWLNEIQMLLFAHPINQAREARNELPINSLWFWGGGGEVEELSQPYVSVLTDSELALAFSTEARIAGTYLPDDAPPPEITKNFPVDDGNLLVVWEGLRHALQRGDFYAWLEKLGQIEQCCLRPLLEALRAGRINRLTLDIPQAAVARRLVLTRGASWKLWRRPLSLAGYVASVTSSL